MPQSHRICCIVPEKPGIWLYLAEILRHAGLPFEMVPAGQAAEALRRPRKVLLVVGTATLSEDAADAVAAAVQAGAALVAVGGTAGLDGLLGVEPVSSGLGPAFEPIGPMQVYAPGMFGISATRYLGEGYLKRTGSHPITGATALPLHIFGAPAVRVQAGDAKVLAELLDVHRKPLGLAGLTVRQVGRGLAILLAPDIAQSVTRIQQGRYVDQDGCPPADGTAPINDGILKAEDGLVLDWTFDRQHTDELGCPAFIVPLADKLRELLIRALLWSATQVQAGMPVLWYHAAGRAATAMLSMDSDGNAPAAAHNAIRLLDELKLKATLCAMVPGYPPEVFDAWKAAGHELALHYDAMTPNTPDTVWGRETFLRQFHGLKDLARLQRIVSNKNHYTRWQGRLEFFEWCAEVGIEADQSRGPSKRGTVGYPFGTCHLHRPMRDDGSIIDVFEVPLSTQDVPVSAKVESLNLWLKGAVDNGGVMHILFHPAHLDKPLMAQALSDIVNASRAKGLLWQRCDEIVAWTRARYQFRAEPEGAAQGWKLSAPTPLNQAALLLFGEPAGRKVCLNDRPVRTKTVKRFGLPCAQVIADLSGESVLQMA